MYGFSQRLTALATYNVSLNCLEQFFCDCLDVPLQLSAKMVELFPHIYRKYFTCCYLLSHYIGAIVERKGCTKNSNTKD